MKDAHARVDSAGGGNTFAGEGVVVFKPKVAIYLSLSLTSPSALPWIIETLDIDGKSYERVGGEKWTVSATKGAPNPMATDSTDLKIAGEDAIGSDKSWHLTGKRSGTPFEEWVRESDGYLLKVLWANDRGAHFAFAFDRFNTGATVIAPAVSEVKPLPKNMTGQVGQAMALNGVNVTVVTAETNGTTESRYRTPAPDWMFVVAQILYENVGSDPVDAGSWSLGDSQGFTYQTTYGVTEPGLGSAKIRSGDTLRGYIAFEVPVNATGLQLTAKIGDDSATVPVG
jgi:hypothetical protein